MAAHVQLSSAYPKAVKWAADNREVWLSPRITWIYMLAVMQGFLHGFESHSLERAEFVVPGLPRPNAVKR